LGEFCGRKIKNHLDIIWQVKKVTNIEHSVRLLTPTVRNLEKAWLRLRKNFIPYIFDPDGTLA